MSWEHGVYSAKDGTLSPPGIAHVREGFEVFAAAVSRTAHSHGWWSDDGGYQVDRNMGEMIALMHSELSEALEAYRNNEPKLWYDHGDGLLSDRVNESVDDFGHAGKPEGIAAEFADVIIRILDTCHTLKIPLVPALLDKHAYNITRTYRHGGKAC